MSQPEFNPFNKSHDLDRSSKGPSIHELREEQRKKELARKNKIDRTEEFRYAKQILRETTPEEVNASELQDTILDDELDFTYKKLEIRKYRDKNNNPYNETNEQGSKSTRDNKRVSLQDMHARDARTQLSANIYADELEKTARIFQKKADDARMRHYFPTDEQEQKEMILGAKAWNLYLEPMVNNKFTSDWSDMFDHFVDKIYKNNKDWTELPYFIREIKYEIRKDGTTASNYEFEDNSIPGSSLINKIRDVIFISDNLPFMRKEWINENKTRFKMIRDQKSKVFKNRKKPKETGDMKAKIRQAATELNDSDEYNTSLSHIHGDPVRRLPDSLIHLNNIKEEYDAIPEAQRLGFMRKDSPEDHTQFFQALNEYGKAKYKEDMEPFMKEIDQRIGELEALKKYREGMRERYGI